jgi:hypothetical protein
MHVKAGAEPMLLRTDSLPEAMIICFVLTCDGDIDLVEAWGYRDHLRGQPFQKTTQ